MALAPAAAAHSGGAGRRRQDSPSLVRQRTPGVIEIVEMLFMTEEPGFLRQEIENAEERRASAPFFDPFIESRSVPQLQ
jgi:hypothetical protein